MKILTIDEAIDLFVVYSDDSDSEKPRFFDDNSDEWVEWLYKRGYRIVKE